MISQNPSVLPSFDANWSHELVGTRLNGVGLARYERAPFRGGAIHRVSGNRRFERALRIAKDTEEIHVVSGSGCGKVA